MGLKRNFWLNNFYLIFWWFFIGFKIFKVNWLDYLIVKKKKYFLKIQNKYKEMDNYDNYKKVNFMIYYKIWKLKYLLYLKYLFDN